MNGEMSAIGTKRTSACAPHMSAFGTKRTFQWHLRMSAFGGEADMVIALRNVR